MNKDQTLLQEAYKKVQKPQSKWEEWLSELDHEVHEDGSITVDGDIDVISIKETQLPFNFREVTGNVFCIDNPNLSSLEGAPQKVGGGFYCNHNDNLKSLEGGPQTVRGDFSCSHNPNLTSLEGAPQKVGRSFDCSHNPNLTSLEGAPQKVGGCFCCKATPMIKSIKGLPKARAYHTQFPEEEIKYRQEMESKLDQETKDVFGDLLADL